MNDLSYKIDVYEGPLDLLLTLISKNKLNIHDIPIAELLEQYMEQIRILQSNLQSENMDIASEFLEMAARLVHIKSVSLLPKHENEEEELKRELTGQLLEYQLCKEMALKLREQVTFDKIAKGQEDIPVSKTYTRVHDSFELVKAYLNAVGRGKRFLPPSKDRFSGIVQTKFVSVSSQIVSILRKLVKNTKVTFSSIFDHQQDKSQRVASFLAILNMVKSKRVLVEDVEDDTVITLIRGGKTSD